MFKYFPSGETPLCPWTWRRSKGRFYVLSRIFVRGNWTGGVILQNWRRGAPCSTTGTRVVGSTHLLAKQKARGAPKDSEITLGKAAEDFETIRTFRETILIAFKRFESVFRKLIVFLNAIWDYIVWKVLILSYYTRKWLKLKKERYMC